MRLFVHVVAFLHLAVYLGVMWYGWQSYKLLRKKSWRYMGAGFGILFSYRVWRFTEQLLTEHLEDIEGALLPFAGAVLLLIAFRMLSVEHKHLMRLMAEPISPRSGAQPVDYWLTNIRKIVREEFERRASMPDEKDGNKPTTIS